MVYVQNNYFYDKYDRENSAVNRQNVWQILKENIIEVFPNLSTANINETDSLKDLGANSIDRAEIIMLTMSRLKLKVPLVAFASAKNIGSLLDIFCSEFESVT